MRLFPPLRRVLLYITLVVLLTASYLVYTLVKVRTTPSTKPITMAEQHLLPLYRHIETLSVRIGSRSVFEYEKLTAAGDYIADELRSMGYRPETQDYLYQDRTFRNIIVTIHGRKAPEEVIIIGAHYDTVFSTPGADDNASGVAALLEMCRILRNDEPGRTLKLIFFTLEEPPIFRSPYQGSVVYARAARQRGEKITAMVCLEMIGYYSERKGDQGFPFPLMAAFYSTTPNFIAVVGNIASRYLVGRVSQSLRSTGTIAVESLTAFGLIPGVDLSDHRSFWDEGYPAVMITDTAFYRNPNYHTGGDTIETLDFRYLSALLEALVKMARDLAGN